MAIAKKPAAKAASATKAVPAAKSRNASKPAASKPAATAKPAAAKPARAAKPVAVALASAATNAKIKAPAVKIKDLMARVLDATGAKKKEAQAVIEATLTALGEALHKGEELNLPGFGRARVARVADKGDAAMLTLKLRRGVHKKKDGNLPLADDEDAD